MRMLLFLSFSLTLAISGFAVVHPGAGPMPPSLQPWTDPLAGLPGRPLHAEAASAIKGGDVVIKLNDSRTKLTVDVYRNDTELRRWDPKPIKTVTIDAHNRIVNTTTAPFMPASAGDRDLMPLGLTTKPAQFPAGTWNITRVYEREDRYGPNMINTNAVGRVDVYAGGVKVGSANDIGYAIHSNSNAFDISRSYGCIIVKASDNALLAGILRADREDAERNGPAGRGYQAINIRERD